MFIYHDMQVSTGGTLRFKFFKEENKHLWGVEYREDPGWGVVKYLCRKNITPNTNITLFIVPTYRYEFLTLEEVEENNFTEVAYFDSYEYSLNYALLTLSNK